MGIVSPLLALPAITSSYGSTGWAAVAIGQSVGAALATLVELGWGLNGPQRVARMSRQNAFRLLGLSLQTKVIVAIPATTAAAIAAWLLAPEMKTDAALVSISTVATAFTAGWFFIGRSRPWAVVLSDGLPRLAFLVTASVLLYWGAPLATYALVGVLIPSILAPIVALLIARERQAPGRAITRRRRLLQSIALQWSAVTARGASALYVALPVTLVTIASPASVPVFAAGERLMRITLAGLSVIPNAMQSWVGSHTSRQARWDAARQAIWLNALVGAVAGVCFALLAPWASEWIFSGVATLPLHLTWLFALVIFIVVVSRATGGLGLVTLNRVQVIAGSAIAGAVVGVPSIVLLSHILGAPGAVLGEIAAEVAVLTVQLLGIRSALSGHR